MAEAAKTGLTLSWGSRCEVRSDCALQSPHGNYCLATFPNVLEGGLASSSWRGTSLSKPVGIDASSWSRRRIPGNTTRILSSKSKDPGTKIFRFGTKKKKAEAEDVDDESNGAANFGTQLLKFATRRGNSSTETTTRGGAKKELIPLSLGRLGRAADARTVFVAGATGQIGARISQQLLRSGFNVRGGVRDLLFAQQLAEFASQYGVISREEARRLNAVEFDFKDVESTAKAIGNAGKVVVTVGPTEDGPRGRVTAREALQVLEAATVANVGHVVIVSEGGAGGGNINNGPLAGISGFFSKLFSRAADITPDSLLEKVVETELRFTFIKASSTDGVDDFCPDGKSLVLLSEGTYNEGTGKVSKVQLASVVASVFGNISIAENKVVEVATIDSAAARPIEELLSSIPVDGRRAALAEARAKAEAEEREKQSRVQAEAEAREALEEARKTAELANQLEQEAKKLAAQEVQATANAEKAKARVQAAAASLEGLGFNVKAFGGNESLPAEDESAPRKKLDIGNFLSKTLAGRAAGAAPSEDKPEEPSKKIDFGSLFSRASDSSEPEEEPVKLRPPAPKRSKPAPPPKTETKKPQKAEPVSFLGGLFKQETIYVDE